MFFVFGVNQREEEIDYDQTIICDVCERYGHLYLFMTYTVLSIFFIPLFKWNRHYYARTSCCNTIYELEEDTVNALLSGELHELKQEDLEVIQRGYLRSHKKCSYCGYETDEDFEYCPKCGKPF